MRVAIVIPTYKRKAKLKRCIDSILGGTYQDFLLFVIADNKDYDTEKFVKEQYTDRRIYAFTMPSQNYVIGCWNTFSQHFAFLDWDLMAWIVDDVELYPNCLEEGVNCFKSNFDNLDGVVGLSQECPNHPEYTYKPFGQVLLGRDFINRYPNRKVCCPAYTHFFQDEEMWSYARGLNKFVECKTAVLKHYHPAFIKNEMDSTHPIVRGKVFQQDKKINEDRHSRGLLWGRSFEL